MTAILAAVAMTASILLLWRRSTPRHRLARVTSSVGSAVPRNDGSGSVHGLVRRWRRRRLSQERESETVETVFALAAELRAGRPPGHALMLLSSSAALLRPALTEAAVAVQAGAGPSNELRRVATLPGCAGLFAVAAAWEVTEAAGGAIADVLERLGEVLESERQAHDAMDAALAAPRATMMLLAGLPLLGILLGQSLGARPLHLLVHRPLGWALLGLGVMLDALGLLWTRLLVRRALR